MNEPLALLLCGRGLIATQLEQRLEGLHYRMVALAAPADLVSRAEREKAMILLADVEGTPEAVIAALEQLRANPATAHIPVIGFAREVDDVTQSVLSARGITTVVSEAAILSHLPQLLDRALDVQ